MSQRIQPVVVSAPGKIILFGEHSVVYGRPAIAIPVTQVSARCTIEPGVVGMGVRVVAQDLGIAFALTETPLENPLAAAIQKTINHLNLPAEPDITLTLTSSIPIARGLGSGAAISTAIVRALGQYFDQIFEPQQVSEIVFEIEKLHHGTPSGIDNTVVAFGQPIFFVKGQPDLDGTRTKEEHSISEDLPKKQEFHRSGPIDRLRVAASLTFIIGDTGVESQTHKVVGDLRARRKREVARYERYFDEMAALTIEARKGIETGDVASIGRCMIANHALLERIGVSSEPLNRLVAGALEAGAIGAKLSGAGWGGNMIAMVESERVDPVVEALLACGATGTLMTQLTKDVSL